jgi:hypothetical protein
MSNTWPRNFSGPGALAPAALRDAQAQHPAQQNEELLLRLVEGMVQGASTSEGTDDSQSVGTGGTTKSRGACTDDAADTAGTNTDTSTNAELSEVMRAVSRNLDFLPNEKCAELMGLMKSTLDDVLYTKAVLASNAALEELHAAQAKYANAQAALVLFGGKKRRRVAM